MKTEKERDNLLKREGREKRVGEEPKTSWSSTNHSLLSDGVSAGSPYRSNDLLYFSVVRF
jgi:hypothetical protein